MNTPRFYTRITAALGSLLILPCGLAQEVEGGNAIVVTGRGAAWVTPVSIKAELTLTGEGESASDALLNLHTNRAQTDAAVARVPGMTASVSEPRIGDAPVASRGNSLQFPALNGGVVMFHRQDNQQRNDTPSVLASASITMEAPLQSTADDALGRTQEMVSFLDLARESGLELVPGLAQLRGARFYQSFHATGNRSGPPPPVQFVAGKTDLTEEAQKLAMEDARRMAELLAECSGRRLGRVKWARVNKSTPPSALASSGGYHIVELRVAFHVE